MGDTFRFYDLETTGLSRAFDQILEFAAIRTDLDLQEIERTSVQIRLRPDVVPSPAAILVNRIRTGRLLSGRCEYEAMGEIHAQLNRPGTTSIGYNSIGFDDEFLRFSFRRNLLPPYTHQFANRCRRMDLLPVTLMYWLHRRSILAWPELNGKASLKLEDIGAANGLFTAQSHAAMSDVEAALRLARILCQDTKMWQYLDGCFRKDTDAQRAEELPVALQSGLGAHRLGLLVASEFGTRHAFQALVLSIGDSIPYPKQTLWLRLDLANLHETQGESVAETAWVVRKRYGEPGILLPPHERYTEQLGAERRRRSEENLDWLRSHPDLFERIVLHHRHYRYPFIPDLDADAGLYQNGFFSRTDEALCRTFHDASVPEKIDIVGRFASREARTLAARLLFRNYPEELPEALQSEALGHLRRICCGEPMLDYTGALRLTPQAALAEIRQLKQSSRLDADQMDLLDELKGYIADRFACPSEGPPLVEDES
jgi:exodeoxyribonuclease-1